MLAGAVGGSALACGVATGPLLATAFDLAGAALTAGIAAHAIQQSARERGAAAGPILRRVARSAAKRRGAPLAAHALDVACRVRAGDPRFLRAAAILLGRATSKHAPGLALQILGSWCSPLKDLSRLAAPLGIARAALESADFVRALTTDIAPASSRFYELCASNERQGRDQRDERDWEVAA